MIVILVLPTVMPSQAASTLTGWLSDKLLHCMEYALLGVVLVTAVMLTWPDRSWVFVVFLTLVIGVGWGAFDEWQQGFIPWRNSDPWDLFADFVGVCIGTAVGYALRLVGRYVFH